ncbi:hypothetical protein, partial [Pontibacter silvestris]|uniref:hypothetical protein n=1 Tax=Pontibacter silvestris TaxID=2305183 RepID=UPI001E4F86AF
VGRDWEFTNFKVARFSGFQGAGGHQRPLKRATCRKRAKGINGVWAREVLPGRCRKKASAFGRGRPGKTLVRRS